MAEKKCPPQERWQDFLIGRVEAQSVTDLEDHLRACPSCLETLNGLQSDDSLVDAIRRPVQKPNADQAAFLENFAQQLRQVDQAPSGNSPDAVTQANALGDRETPPAGEDMLTLLGFLQPAQGPDELGRLGGYRIIKVLGVGGMGVVFLAEDTLLKRQVALKAMKPILAVNAGAGQRFEREAQAAAAINHDNVITIHQVGFDKGIPFLAMELLEGETLDQRLRREGTLPVADVLRIGQEIAEGLAAAHARGLIHRDVKPANVWLQAPGDRVKLVDFGLVHASGKDVQITREGAIVGTPAFMAPEQAQGAKVDARADLFSLGCLLYRVAVGRLPFQGNDPVSILYAIGTESPVAPNELNPSLPNALSELILQLLAKKPADRPESARALADRLKQIELHPNASFTPPRKSLRWVLGTLALATLTALLWLVGSQSFRFNSDEGANADFPTGQFLLVSRRTGNAEIFLIDSDPSKAKNLTKDKAENLWPAWSPDGKQIAFTSNRDGTWQLFLMAADGTQVKQLTAGDDSSRLPSWSADGKKIVFVRALPTGSTTFIMDADGGNVTKVGPGTDPAISPDGKRILFANSTDKGFRVHVMDLNGENIIPLTTNDNPRGDVFPSWSPDGKKIAWTDSVGAGLEIFVANHDGTNASQLTTLGGFNIYPTWLPHGNQISFYHCKLGEAGVYYRIEADGSNLRELLRNEAKAGRLAWRPK